MKRTIALIAPVVALATLPTRADSFDCFPMCAEDAAVAAAKAQAAYTKPLNLCENATVREVAKIDNCLAPAKKLYSIATNPEGFALQQVSEHIVHLPPWVNYVANPRGALRAKAIDMVRYQAKKQVGLQDECKAEIKAETPIEAPASNVDAAPADANGTVDVPVTIL